MVLSISHDTWCPHSCKTAQKVPYPAHHPPPPPPPPPPTLALKILTGALFETACWTRLFGKTGKKDLPASVSLILVQGQYIWSFD